MKTKSKIKVNKRLMAKNADEYEDLNNEIISNDRDEMYSENEMDSGIRTEHDNSNSNFGQLGSDYDLESLEGTSEDNVEGEYESADYNDNEYENGDESGDESDEKIFQLLIVDDEKEVLDAMAMTLKYAKEFECVIFKASNGKEALKLLESQEFDMVLSDYKMPGMNGVEVLNAVKDIHPDAARILITGFTDINIAKDAINQAEVHQYIEKPWDNNNLRDIVFDLLQKKVQGPDQLADSKEKVRKWLIEMFNDAKGMGLDVTTVSHYVERAQGALESYEWDKALTYATQSVNSMINLAENSYPDLKIQELKNIQLRADKWNEINIQVTNDGNIHAKDIQVNVDGEFDIKPQDKIPIIEVGETKLLKLEIYPIKKGLFPLEVELACKKSFDNLLVKYKQQLWIQIGDVTGKTKLKRKFGYENGYVKMELHIINEDLRDIKNVHLELLFDEDILILSDIKPVLSKVNKKFKIGNINSCEGKNVVIYFDPMSCSDTFISGGVSFRDWEDNDKYLMLEPQKIKILSPQLSTLHSIGLTDLRTLLDEELQYTGSKILNIPLGLNLEDTYRTCKELIYKFNTKLINEMYDKSPYIIESWFYGVTQDTKNKFALKVRIDEETNSVELQIAASNNAALTGLLTDIFFKLNHDLQSRGIIMEPLMPIENMALKDRLISARPSLLAQQLEALDKNLEVDFTQNILDRSKAIGDHLESISRNERMHIGKRRDSLSKMK
jgi:CheY-like chemotaxis protein